MAGATVDRVYAGIGGDHVRATNSMGVVAISEEEVTEDDVERCHIVARAVALPPDREMVHAIPQEYRVDSPGRNQGSDRDVRRPPRERGVSGHLPGHAPPQISRRR